MKPFSQVVSELKDEHVRRYADFLKVSTGLAFGAILFLMAFRKDYVSTASHHTWLVHAAWHMSAASALAGFALLSVWVDVPVRRLEAARIEQSPRDSSQFVVRVPGAVPRWQVSLWIAHEAGFFLTILCLWAFKILNWDGQLG
jgi:hypothetical protein